MACNPVKLIICKLTSSFAVYFACLFIAVAPSCTNLAGAFRPFSPTMATLRGLVCDSTLGKVGFISKALVEINDQLKQATTDSIGIFFIQNALTGPAAPVTVTCPGYDTLRTSVDITLDPPIDTFYLSPRYQRPFFSLVRAQPDDFISNVLGYMEIIIIDPDTHFTQVKIDWGDGSDPGSFKLLQNTCWHRYVLAKDSVMNVVVGLFDATGFVGDTELNVPVSVASPPLLDGKIFFEPSNYLAPYDDSVVIGVRIVQIEGWPSEIVWIINEHDPQAILKRMYYNEQTGAIGPIGDVFVFRFPTATLKGTNEVQIIVSDRYGNTSSVFGNFYIAGKSE
jgi:hypothetical protein